MLIKKLFGNILTTLDLKTAISAISMQYVSIEYAVLPETKKEYAAKLLAFEQML